LRVIQPNTTHRIENGCIDYRRTPVAAVERHFIAAAIAAAGACTRAIRCWQRNSFNKRRSDMADRETIIEAGGGDSSGAFIAGIVVVVLLVLGFLVYNGTLRLPAAAPANSTINIEVPAPATPAPNVTIETPAP
jgi:hypothetical protein